MKSEQWGKLPMHRRIYPIRAIGSALAGMPVATVLYLRDASLVAWVFLLLGATLWSHLAYLMARRSPDPYRAEVRNLLIDSALIASWLPLMHFSLLPSILLITLTSVDRITTGGGGLWLRSLPGVLLAVLIMSVFTSAEFEPATSMPVLLACLPVMIIHSILVSFSSNRLIRKVSRQNLELDRLHRIDALTGLSARADWEQHAERVLVARSIDGADACLLLMDVDNFKQVNDRYGHAAGDEVLRAMAGKMRSVLRPLDRAGRIGGDEFVVLLPTTGALQAAAVAERLRAAVESVRLREYPDIHPTISIGIAVADKSMSLRTWLSAADAALYRAKDHGRNCAMT